MPDSTDRRSEVERFIIDQIETVPHLEALLQLWNTRPRCWSAETLRKVLYVNTATAQDILQDLSRRRLIVGAGDQFNYNSEPALDDLMREVESTYRRELVRVSKMIHSKPSSALREFSKAFQFRKDRG